MERALVRGCDASAMLVLLALGIGIPQRAAFAQDLQPLFVAAGDGLGFNALGAAPADSVLFDFSITNNGAGVSNNWIGTIYLSSDNVITSADTYICDFNGFAMGAASTVVSNTLCQLPASLGQGGYYIGIIVDRLNSITEGNEADNNLASSYVYTICTDGGIEPNGNRFTSTLLNSFPATLNNYLCGPRDEDWYAVSLNAGQTVTAALQPPFLDYDLYLHDNAGNLLAASTLGGSQVDSIQYTAPTTQTYHVRVVGFSGAHSPTMTYQLRVQRLQDALALTPGNLYTGRTLEVAPVGSTTPIADSVFLVLTGPTSGTRAWSATHRAAATWNTINTTGGVGSGVLSYTRNPTGLTQGTYVDSITVTSAGATGSPAIYVDTLVVHSSVSLLTNGVGQSVSGAAGSAQLWGIDVPPNASNLTINLTANAGDADMFVAFNRAPRLGDFDCAPYSGGPENCTFPTPSTGRYYILLQGFGAYNNETLTASFTSQADTLGVTPLGRWHIASTSAVAMGPDSATVTIFGPGASTTAWTATHRAAATWNTLTTASGNGSGKVRWTRSSSGLAAGMYIDTITITATGVINSPQRVIDTLIVSTPVTLAEGAPVNLGALGVGQGQVIDYTQPAGTNRMEVTATAPTGDLSLYFFTPAQLAAFMHNAFCAQEGPGTPTETCIAASVNGAPSPSPWVVVVRVVSPVPSVTVTVLDTALLTLALQPNSRRDSVGSGSVAVRNDSTLVVIGGPGASGVVWSATHGGAAWNTLVTTGGTGPGMLRWTRNPTGLTDGVYVDTITVTAAVSTGSPARLIDTLVVGTGVPLVMTVTPNKRIALDTTFGTPSRPDSASLTFTGPGAASAVWTMTHSAAATWNTVVTGGGTGNALLRWTRNLVGLAAGTYVDTLTVSSAGAVGSPATVIDTLVLVANPRTLSIAPTRFWRPAVNGVNAMRTESVTVNITGTGAGSTQWFASSTGNAGTIGVTSNTGPGAFAINRNTTGLSSGLHVDTISVTASAAGSPAVARDSVHVAVLIPTDITAGASVSAVAGTLLAYRVVAPAGNTTVTASVGGGTGSVGLYLAPDDSARVLATSCGTFTTGSTVQCMFSAPGPLAQQDTFYVLLRAHTDFNTYTVQATVTAQLALALVPTGRSAAAAVGSTAGIVDSTTVQLTGPNASTTNWTATHRAAATWLSLHAGGGAGTQVLRWTRDPTGLALGSYVDTITVSAAGAVGSPAILVDTLVVGQALALAITPTSKRDSVALGTTGSKPDTANVVLTGVGASSTGWQTSHRAGATWNTITVGTGTGSGIVVWTRNYNGLAAGIYVDSITISAPGTGLSPVYLTDTLIVAAALTLTVTPLQHKDSTFVGLGGTRNDSASVSLAGLNAGSTQWNAAHRAAATWNSLTSSSGTGQGMVRWTRSYQGLAAGTYVDTITVTVAGAGGSPARIIDSLLVRPPPVSGAASADALLGGAALTAAQIQYLDQQGNNNGTFDLGDFLAFIRKNPGAVAPETAEEVITTVRPPGGSSRGEPAIPGRKGARP